MNTTHNKIASLDGLRALAVVAVMLVHIGFPGFVLGGLGVDLFFALSGFLITHLFIREHRLSGRVSLLQFWARRFLRLMPVYWVYLSVITASMVLGYGELREHGGWTPNEYIASMWLYFVNYVPSGGIWSEQHLTIHLWSLAIEEQFYLVWPLIIIMLFRGQYVVRGTVFIFVIFLFYYLFVASDVELLKTITGRGITLLLGCLCAVLCNEPSWKRYFTAVSMNYIGVIVVLALGVMTLLTYLGYYEENDIKIGFAAYFGALFCYLIGCLYHQSGTFTHRVLELPLLVYIGKISYGVYLYHLAIQLLVWKGIYPDGVFGSPVDYLLRVIAYFVLTLGLASVSFYTIESYFLKFKDQFRYR